MEEIDYFKGVADQEFVDYYKVDLYSRMEITLYTYPHEFVEEDPQPWEHLNRCEGILYEYLYNAYEEAKYQRWKQEDNEDSKISDDDFIPIDPGHTGIGQTPEEKAEKYAAEQRQRDAIVKAKMQELVPELGKVTDAYLKIVKLSFVDL